MKTFYTYLYLREDGTPYYVGKGSGYRAFSKNHRTPPPKDKNLILLQEFPDAKTAQEAEIFLISLYGRTDAGTGCLRNLTDGGEGGFGNRNSVGRKHSMETRLRISAAKKDRPLSAAHKKAIGDAQRGVPWTATRRAAQALIAKKVVHHDPCHCGLPFHAKGLCARHYYREYERRKKAA